MAESMPEPVPEPPTVAQRAARSDPLRRLAQLGLAGYGFLHLLVAWLALELAWGQGPAPNGRTTDQAGALEVLARSPPAASCSGCWSSA